MKDSFNQNTGSRKVLSSHSKFHPHRAAHGTEAFQPPPPRGIRQFNPLVFEASYRDNKDSVGTSVGIVPDCGKHHLKRGSFHLYYFIYKQSNTINTSVLGAFSLPHLAHFHFHTWRIITSSLVLPPPRSPWNGGFQPPPPRGI